MKRLLTLIFLAAFSTGALAQTADEIVNKFIDAIGGKQKLSEINTLQFRQVINFKSPIGDMEIPMNFYRDKNKLFRLETSLQFGGQSMNFFTLLNDKEGFIMTPSNPMFGMEGGLQKLSEKDRVQQAYQMDAAGMFSLLVDYAGKGHTLELVKEEKVNKEDTYKIKQKLAGGGELFYYVSKATNLVVKVDAKGAMAASMSGLGAVMNGMGGGGRADKMEVSTSYAAYQDFDGFKFPTKVVISSPMGELESSISNIKVNKEISPELYKAQ